MPTNMLIRKLEVFGPLSVDDKAFLGDLVRKVQRLPAKTRLIDEGDQPTDVHLVLEGFACRLKNLQDGSRQIFAYLIPGDFCDANVFILKAMDHAIETLSPCMMVDIPRTRMLEMMARPNLARAVWWATLVDEATLREWLVNMGRRPAAERIAHLICELHLRLASVGLVTGGSFELPLTQLEIGDTMGLSGVHVNRAIQTLRGYDFFSFRSGQMSIHNIKRLQAFCDFNPNYLHLDGGKRDEPSAP